MVFVSSKENLVELELSPFSLSPTVIVGYVKLIASLFIYALCEYAVFDENLFMAFWVHYIISVVYTVMLITQRSYGLRRSWKMSNIHETVIAINIYLISAYALNRVLHVFSDSETWLCAYILLTSATLLSMKYSNALPAWAARIQLFVLGSAMVFYLYLSVFVAPHYALGAVGLVFFGIGIHVLVPAALLVTTVAVVKHSGTSRKYYWAGAGMLSTVFLITIFVMVWTKKIGRIERLINQSVMTKGIELPLWVLAARDVDDDWIMSRILKSHLVYSTPNDRFWSRSFGIDNPTWDESKKHDPLVFISSLFKTCPVSDHDRIQILKAISGGRHKSNERLWRGDNLTTSYIVSDIDIYPALRLAYTEKYVDVKNSNTSRSRWSGNSQEAIYTFYLPEGSIVTSLSLWMNGVESKSILTSKQKAQAAYRQIVGVENRDPSVVHWQEGNTITLRVFPCTRAEDRKFKIGVTTPLSYRNGVVSYSDFPFEGPDASNATEVKRVRFIGPSGDVELPSGLKKDDEGSYRSEGKYDPDFHISFASGPIPDNHFTFDGFAYSVSEFKQSYQHRAIGKIYLDINASWSPDELDELKEILHKYEMYVDNNEEFVRLDDQNWTTLTESGRERKFSIFPFHRIKDLSNTLVVTKGKTISPHLSDFKSSSFAKAVNDFFALGNKVNVYNLRGGCSTYIKSLKEFRTLNYAVGSPAELKTMLASGNIHDVVEDDGQIVLFDAGMIVRKSVSGTTTTDTAPDHLARLFAYNDIMRKAGLHFLDENYVDDELVNAASKAYVVSPVSSLIVLESKKDYDRFDIAESVNSLKNATRNSSGAVPEPHEWALIIVFALLILYIRLRSN